MRASGTRARRAGWLLVVGLGATLWATEVGGAQHDTGPTAPPEALPATDDCA